MMAASIFSISAASAPSRPPSSKAWSGFTARSRTKDDELAAKAYRAWGFKTLTPELVQVLNMWAGFIFAPLLDDRVRVVDDGVPAAEYGLKQANDVHKKLKALGGIRPPREFVFMDRAAIGLGGALIRLGAQAQLSPAVRGRDRRFRCRRLGEASEGCLQASRRAAAGGGMSDKPRITGTSGPRMRSRSSPLYARLAAAIGAR